MRALVLLAPFLFGCTLLRDADDVVVGNGALSDAAVDSNVMDSPGALDVRESGAADYRWALWRMPPNTPTAYETMGEIVVDRVTGLQWQRAAGPAASYEDAAAACAAKGWRLPTRVELISLLAITRTTHPAILSTAFPATPQSELWTSSTLAVGGRYVVHFGNATVKSALGTESYSYRCVRAP